MTSKLLLEILKEHTFLTIGCTDPVAVGLSAAFAYKAIGGEIFSVDVIMDKNIYKDAISVGIPGTMKTVLDLAVSLSVLFGNPENGLRLLKYIDEQCVVKAEKFLSNHKISFSLNEEVEGIYIKSIVKTSKGIATALIRNSHDNIVEITVNQKITYSKRYSSTPEDSFNKLGCIANLTIEDIFKFIKEIDSKQIAFLNQGIQTNLKAAQIGEKKRVGLGVGKLYQEMIEKGYLPDDVSSRVKQNVGAAADARMSGMNVPIYGCFGSGNHGITLFITMGMMAEHLKISKEETSRALSIALLIIGVIKTRTGILTPHCGCSVAAGAGAASGIAYMLGGKEKEVENTVHFMLANLTGTLCDGAKYGCALKMATSAGAAIECAYMAMLNAKVPGNNGIVGWNMKQTMDNLKIITEYGMKNIDKSVLAILLKSPYFEN